MPSDSDGSSTTSCARAGAEAASTATMANTALASPGRERLSAAAFTSELVPLGAIVARSLRERGCARGCGCRAVRGGAGLRPRPILAAPPSGGRRGPGHGTCTADVVAGDEPAQRLRLLDDGLAGGGGLFDEGGVLLGGGVHLHDGLVDLLDAA